MNTEKEPLRIRVVTAVVLFLVFLSGLATGAAVVHLTRERPPPPPMPSLQGIDLSAAQRARVNEIRARYRPQLDAILRATFPKVRSVEDAMDRDIRAQLTPAQQQRFDENEAHRPPLPPQFGPPPGPPPLPPG